MIDPRPVWKEMLTGRVGVKVDSGHPGFAGAKALASAKAAELNEDPVLLAWYDGNTGEHSPAIC